ncbi:MAG: bifunctional folylpolyglutamate synthase/dihydrofolate synthase [Sphingobacteriales bacterium]|nr:MAG: bifunctional folylpolyglutamate synthase/dihydrofolate synthase [Sphingobacteriales bacterium]
MHLAVPLDYESAVKFMFEQLPMFSKTGVDALNPKLDKIIQLCNLIGNPEQQFKSVHIAGTNGKGSTSHILAACLQEAGYKTGLYTSPHLIDLRERIRINGALLHKELLTTFINSFWAVIQEVQPSYFELNVALAFWAFAKEGVDIAVIETGLGGKWDSTNIITPEVSVITNISLDHTHILGHSIPEIAGEKAGIIKPKTPVIIGLSQEETAAVFSRQAILNQTQLTYADIMFEGAIVHTSAEAQTIKFVDTRNYNIIKVTTDLLGSFQVDNLKTALATIVTLQHLGWKVDIDIFCKAVAQVKTRTGLRGRWEFVRSKPLVIADVAHNPNGIAMIVRQLQHTDLNQKKQHIIIGFVADKDVKEALSLLPQNATYYFTQAQILRALAAEDLKKIAAGLNLEGNTYPTVSEAITQALKHCDEADLVLITGSFFIVGEALEFLDNKTI